MQSMLISIKGEYGVQQRHQELLIDGDSSEDDSEITG
jgi:hypothetical protein